MASGNLYDAVLVLLAGASGDGDSGDVYAAINAEQGGFMVTGSVIVARKSGDSLPRKTIAPALTVEIVDAGERPDRQVGPGIKERDILVDLAVALRQKDLAPGKTQLLKVQNVVRALVARYDGVSNLTVTATNATWRRVAARVTELDEDPEEQEVVRATVRTTWTFTEAQASNV